jgi:hypothetical protein
VKKRTVCQLQLLSGKQYGGTRTVAARAGPKRANGHRGFVMSHILSDDVIKPIRRPNSYWFYEPLGSFKRDYMMTNVKKNNVVEIHAQK